MTAASPSIPLLDLGIAINVLGILVPAVISGFVSRRYGDTYFRFWTLNLITLAVAVLLLGWATLLGHPWALLGPAAILYVLHTYCLFLARFSLQGRATPRWAAVLAVLTAFPATALVTSGALSAGIALAALYNIGGQCHLGVSLSRQPGSERQRGLRLTLAGLIIASGAWALTFPLWENSLSLWLGYAIAGAFHLVIGLAMILYVLDDAAERLRAKNEALAQLDRLKTDFVATVSHELRTPLTVIKSGLGLLEDDLLGPLTPDQRGVLANISANGDRLHALINDLLDFARLESGQLSFHRERGDVREVLLETVEQLRPRFTTLGLQLSVHIDQAPLMVEHDTQRLYQVIANLLDNAAKFTPTGGEVTLSCRADAGGVLITVSDTGTGIAPEHHATIFTKFFQVDGSSTRSVNGAGLGLPIAKAIVEKGHGGRMWVESAEGAGSAFHVWLPAAEGPVPLRPQPVC
ncbi:MAG: sensor histidine kinase [Candidatus Sericytochromatia bacterium]